MLSVIIKTTEGFTSMVKAGLDYWTDRLRHQSLPVLGDVIAELNKVSNNADADASQLSEVILKDPTLTSKVLKVANSVQYNYISANVNTVSRAVVNIGMRGVRAICISSMVMDALVKGKPKGRLLELVAQGFHAATQAQNIYGNADKAESEEVFIAALLYNLGEMAFWSSEDVDSDNEALLSESPTVRRDAMEALLGTSFKAITRELGRHWQLGDTLGQALNPGKSPSSKVLAVVAGERLSRATRYGWGSPQLKKVLKETAALQQCSMKEALTRAKQGADLAGEVAKNYGVPDACPLIPKSLENYVMNRKPNFSQAMKADANVQLNVLRDLSRAVEDGLDVNKLFHLVIEGMHKGIGLERVCIALVIGHRLVGKYMLGDGTEKWHGAFSFDVGPFSESLFIHTMEKEGTHWFTEDDTENKKRWYTSEVIAVVGKHPAFTHLLDIDGRKAALFYADRADFGGDLDQDKFDTFKHFAEQTQMALNNISRSHRPASKPSNEPPRIPRHLRY